MSDKIKWAKYKDEWVSVTEAGILFGKPRAIIDGIEVEVEAIADSLIDKFNADIHHHGGAYREDFPHDEDELNNWKILLKLVTEVCDHPVARMTGRDQDNRKKHVGVVSHSIRIHLNKLQQGLDRGIQNYSTMKRLGLTYSQVKLDTDRAARRGGGKKKTK